MPRGRLLKKTCRTTLPIYEDWGQGRDTKAIRSSPIQLKEIIPCHKMIVETWNTTGLHIAASSTPIIEGSCRFASVPKMLPRLPQKHSILEACHFHKIASVCRSVPQQTYPMRYRSAAAPSAS
ncbi:hypothetical protein EVAR_55099_1 [Eumeta japonica]|uniref:Uncharacterized protein n=1 Tax=Eumeta variegata TaxID=151549 RepID=A0A4C1YJN1_EUMVA|nr:hypothetical protein EVAR_55099_1 [Eumeta japonica]